jgi:sulfide:quinone oxidoreductase
VAALDPARKVAVFDGGGEMAYDLFLGVPKHRAPDVVMASGMVDDVYIPVNPRTLQTRYAGVYAVGDVAAVGVPKAGVFAEGAARVVAQALIARIERGVQAGEEYDGRGSCYIEFGGGRVGRVDVDFMSGPKPTGTFHEPSEALVEQKQQFGASRRARWFGR